ncbi:hypothetical protein EDD27_6019 [Nonomuraea polychroma]|uniref:Uncharacterized protein n=1 Tax=Nonomuraea polychroma TaxID=46176 RepID=A0A438MCD0_9ACTN|nr:hypothetical protein EDD27_6019 [Nonomuraea polychroma]
MRGKFVRQNVGVCRHDRVANLHSPPIQVISSANQAKHRHSGRKSQKPCLLLGRHPGMHIFREPLQGVSEILKTSVNSTRPGIRLFYRCASRNIHRKIRDRCLYRLPVERVPATPSCGHLTATQPQPLRDLRGRRHFLHGDHVNIRFRADLTRFGKERSFTLFAMTSSKPVRGKSSHHWAGSDVNATPMLRNDQAFGLQSLERVPHRHACHTVVLHQPGFRGKLVTLAQPSALNRITKLISDLSEYGTVTGRIHRSKAHHLRAHRNSSTRTDVY